MTTTDDRVRVVGGGLAGCEVALRLAERGLTVELWEMKPKKRTPAQVSDRLAELVCSNSFRSANVENAIGLLKEEMRQTGSHLMRFAQEAKVPAGDALAVDRDVFAALVEGAVERAPSIEVVHDEVTALFDDGVWTVYATGPLTAETLADDIARACGQERLAFYDAIAPIVDADSIDWSRAYKKSRYDKGDGDDYVNCPMTADEFDAFLDALLAADQVSKKEFEDLHYFEGCLPIEVMAGRGRQTLSYGPMKPVGLEHPETGTRYAAVLQLRKENVHGTAYNLVGCQTRLKQPAQRAVFRLVPGLQQAVFLRYGAIHRNTYLDSPRLLDAHFRLNGRDDVFFAGQLTGVEGYVESMACGMLCADALWAARQGRAYVPPPPETALGGLYRHVRGTDHVGGAYGPSNINWSLIAPLPGRVPKRDKKRLRAERALAALDAWRTA